jgi:isopentenyl diphosphate isomerase/L-lactate dehydrogenase-like FMN-dependent dehydrogenase
MAADLTRAYNIDDLRSLARRRLPRMVFDFYDGGAEDEVTLRGNRAAFERLRLVPKILRDVSKVDTGCEILGSPADLPMIIAPTGGVGFSWPAGDVAIARAAKAFGIPCTLSTSTTATVETIAEEAGGRLWFQLYVLHDRAFTAKLVARAAAAGCEALVVTADLATGGKRERDFRNRFALPFRLGPTHVLQACTKLGWSWNVLTRGVPIFENLRGLVPPGNASAATIASSVGREIDASLSYEDVARQRDAWKGKLLVKGVARADDAERLLRTGVDGLWLSNHGGRQLDGAIAPVEALPAIVAAVGGRVPILLDSGVRRGSDVLKARALGAQAVAIGRATLFGVAAAGEAGARRALEILSDELARSMQLCGAASIAEITPDLICSQ